MTGDHIYIAMAITDGVLGLLLVFSLASTTTLYLPKWHRFFVSVASAGLLSQSVLMIGHINGYSVDEFWWSWGAKDIYADSLALTYFIIVNHRNFNGHTTHTLPPSDQYRGV